MQVRIGLRYRGSDARIRATFSESQEDRVSLDNQGSIKNSPAYLRPPTDQPSLSHRLAESLKAGIKTALSCLTTSQNTMQKIFDTAKMQLSSNLKSLEKVYQTLSQAEKEFVDTISSQMKHHYVTQPILAMLGINPVMFALMGISFQAGIASGQISEENLEDLIFFDGAPENGTNLCADVSGDCGQFYVDCQNQTIAQGASILTSTHYSVPEVISATNSCGDKSQLMSFFKWLFGIQNITVFGNKTCQTSAASDGQTVHRNNILIGVSQKVCDELQANSDKNLVPCIQNGVHSLDVSDKSYINPTNQNNSSFNLLWLTPLFTWPWVFYFLYRRNRQQAQEASESTAQQPIPAEAKSTIPEEKQSNKTLPVTAETVDKNSLFSKSKPAETEPAHSCPEAKVTFHSS